MGSWDTPFDVSMLGNGKRVTILCETEQDAAELMVVLLSNDIKWVTGDRLNPEKTNFGIHQPTCYFVDGSNLRYGSTDSAERSPWNSYTKCTFYAATQEFEAADENEFLAMIGGK